jgi:hypothetical protein
MELSRTLEVVLGPHRATEQQCLSLLLWRHFSIHQIVKKACATVCILTPGAKEPILIDSSPTHCPGRLWWSCPRFQTQITNLHWGWTPIQTKPWGLAPSGVSCHLQHPSGPHPMGNEQLINLTCTFSYAGVAWIGCASQVPELLPLLAHPTRETSSERLIPTPIGTQNLVLGPSRTKASI